MPSLFWSSNSLNLPRLPACQALYAEISLVQRIWRTVGSRAQLGLLALWSIDDRFLQFHFPVFAALSVSRRHLVKNRSNVREEVQDKLQEEQRAT